MCYIYVYVHKYVACVVVDLLVRTSSSYVSNRVIILPVMPATKRGTYSWPVRYHFG